MSHLLPGTQNNAQLRRRDSMVARERLDRIVTHPSVGNGLRAHEPPTLPATRIMEGGRRTLAAAFHGRCPYGVVAFRDTSASTSDVSVACARHQQRIMPALAAPTFLAIEGVPHSPSRGYGPHEAIQGVAA
jgi:hypothetical protein